MKRFILSCILLASIAVSTFAQQNRVFYNPNSLDIVLHKLSRQKFKVKSVSKKFALLKKHSTLINPKRAQCTETAYYTDFVEEWKKFIESLKGEEKEKFMKFAQENGLDNFDSSL